MSQDSGFGLYKAWHGIVWREEGSDLKKKQAETVFGRSVMLGHPNLNLVGKKKYTEMILTTAKYSFKKMLGLCF